MPSDRAVTLGNRARSSSRKSSSALTRIAQEVHISARPAHAFADFGDRFLQPGMIVRPDDLNAIDAAGPRRKTPSHSRRDAGEVFPPRQYVRF